MFQHFLRVISARTFAILVVSCAATYLCLRVGFVASLPKTLVGIAVVFPMVFSIGAAYRRREEALRSFASLKAHLSALVYASYDWSPSGSREMGEKAVALSALLLKRIKKCLETNSKNLAEDLDIFYQVHKGISLHVETLRERGMAPTDTSRVNSYLKNIIVEFEKMRNIACYRTPLSLRAYSKIFLHAFPIVFAPHFAHLSQDYTMPTGFLVACIYSLVLVSLDHIQDDLENPFDGDGPDDINLNIISEFERISKR